MKQERSVSRMIDKRTFAEHKKMPYKIKNKVLES